VIDLVRRRHLQNTVRFMGPVSPVSTAYHRARVVVLSSISEGLPYTVIEAMMCGRATVSTDVGGVREVVGDAGLLVPPRDPRSLASALALVLTDDALRHGLAERATGRGRCFFRLEQMLGTFRAEYARLIRPQQAEFTPWPSTPEPVPTQRTMPSLAVAIPTVVTP
jgi:glycosyltransferase involved in cell wall biosynthesis